MKTMMIPGLSTMACLARLRHALPTAQEVAQVSNLLYRRLPVGRLLARVWKGGWSCGLVTRDTAGWKPAPRSPPVGQCGRSYETCRLVPWLRRVGRLPQVRLTMLAIGSALALGGVATPPGTAPAGMERVGSWPGYARGPALDVALAGHFAYVAIGEGGLLVLDVADPAKPVRIGEYSPPGRTELVRVAGSRAYLGTSVHMGGGCEMEGWRGQLIILDVSDPTRPIQLGSYMTGSGITSLFVEGDRVYLGDNGNHAEASLHILDVSNPARPLRLAVDHARGPTALWVGSNAVYEGSWSSLSVLNVSAQGSINVVADSETNVGMTIRGIQAIGHWVYVASGDGGNGGYLDIFETGSTPAPRSLAILDLNNAAMDIQVVGDYAYLALADAGLTVVDVHNPNKPVRLGTCGASGVALQVEVAGGNAYVADYHGGLQIIDVRDPTHLVRVTSFDTGLTTHAVRLSGDKAYLLSSDTHPSIATGVRARSRVEVVDVSHPTRPALLGAFDSDRLIGSFDVAGELAYLGSTVGLQILDFHHPAQPVSLGDTSIKWQIDSPYTISVCASGSQALVGTIETGQLCLRIFDVSNPANLLPLGRTNVAGANGGGAGVRALGHRACLSCAGQLYVLNVANPMAPAVTGSVDLPFGGNQSGLCVLPDYAYIGESWDGFTIVDVRSPAKPVVAGGYDTLGEVNDLWSDARYTYVAEGWEGLEVFDVSEATQPVPIALLTTRGQARGVEVKGDYAYVAEGGSGLAILRLFPGPVTVVENPASSSAACGDATTLTVRAYGRGPLNYQWYQGETGDVSHPVAGATSASFTTPPLTQAAAYWVRISSGASVSDSQTAWVNLVPPVSVELVSLWPGWRRGAAAGVQVAGNLAYFAMGDAGLWIYNVSNSSAPEFLASAATKGSASAIALLGTRAFLACGDQGLEVMEVGNPSAPARIGSLKPTGYANHLAVAGSYAYLLGDQICVVDISDPSQPRLVGSFATNGNAIAVSGEYAYLAGERYDNVANVQRGFLAVLDLRDKSDPRLLGAFGTFGGANGVAVSGDYAYLVTSSYSLPPGNQQPGSLYVIDVRNPAQLSRIASITLTDGNTYESTRDLFVSDGCAYVAISAGLQVIDISNPATPRRSGRVDLQNARALVVSGHLAYVAEDRAGFQVIDVATSNFPKLLGGTQAPSGFAVDVAVSGQHAFLADSSGGLKLLDVSDPRTPSLLGVYRSKGDARHVAAGGPHAYLAADSVEVLDVSDPTLPYQSANVDVGWTEDVMLANNCLYLTGWQFRTVDARNPAKPQVCASQPLSAAWGTVGMSVVGRYGGVGQGWGGLQLLDLSVPTEPKWVGAYYSGDPVSQVAMSADLACVTLGSESPALEVIDLRDVQRPVRTARLALPAVSQIALRDNYACVTGEGLAVFDLSNPYQPIRVGSHTLDSQTLGLQLVGDLAYVAAGDYGLAIYRLTPQLRLDSPLVDGNGVNLSWLGEPGIRLQSTTNLAAPDWQDVPNSVGVSHLQCSPTNRAAFYRLVRPSL
jgi:hypothetical protein